MGERVEVVGYQNSQFGKGSFHKKDGELFFQVDIDDFYGLGMLEGYFMADMIYKFYQLFRKEFIEMYSEEMWEKVFESVGNDFELIKKMVNDNENNEDVYIDILNSCILQLNGIKDAQNQYCKYGEVYI